MHRALSFIVLCIALGRITAQQPDQQAVAIPSTSVITKEHRYFVHASCKDKPFVLERATTKVVSGHQAVKDFSITPASDLPLRYVLLLDISGSTRTESSFIAQHAPLLINDLNSLGGQGALGVSGGSVAFDDQNAAGNRVARLMRRSKTLPTSALYDSLLAAIEVLPKRFPVAGPRRYALFVITDAEDNQSAATLATVVGAAIKERVAIYPIILKIWEKKGLDRARLDRAGENLVRAAIATGGAWFVLPQPEEFVGNFTGYLKAQQVLTLSGDFEPRDIVITSSKCESLGVALTAASRP